MIITPKEARNLFSDELQRPASEAEIIKAIDACIRSAVRRDTATDDSVSLMLSPSMNSFVIVIPHSLIDKELARHGCKAHKNFVWNVVMSSYAFISISNGGIKGVTSWNTSWDANRLSLEAPIKVTDA